MRRIPTIVLAAAFAAAASHTFAENGGNVRTIEMVAADDMTYSVAEIRAAPGERLRVVLTTNSRMPPMAMGHNFVLIQPDTDVDAFVAESAMARTRNYIAPSMRRQVIAWTPMAAGGETVEVTFEAPTTPGTYLYVCTFPGHFSAGQVGRLIVE